MCRKLYQPMQQVIFMLFNFFIILHSFSHIYNVVISRCNIIIMISHYVHEHSLLWPSFILYYCSSVYILCIVIILFKNFYWPEDEEIPQLLVHSKALQAKLWDQKSAVYQDQCEGLRWDNALLYHWHHIELGPAHTEYYKSIHNKLYQCGEVISGTRSDKSS